jgi:secondary thiamine-phosphate synthase enzyme
MIFIRKNRKSKSIKFTPKIGNTLYDITSLIELSISNFKLKNGLINLHVRASTAAILIQENGESRVKRDIVHFLYNMVQNNDDHKTNIAHLKAALIGPSKTIPIIKGKLALSKCQKIFICEFDVPNIEREILITPFHN